MTCGCGECVALAEMQWMGLQDELEMMVFRARVNDLQDDWARVQVNDMRERNLRGRKEEEAKA